MKMRSMFTSRRSLTALLLGLFTAVVLVAAVQGPVAVADPTGPSVRDRQITLTVVSLLRREHLSEHAIDDEISERTLTNFLDALDPMKLYFYQSDVDAFRQKKHAIDEMVRRGDISLAYDIFRTFLARVDERVKTVDELLATDHDFTVDERMVTDRDALSYPKTPREARDRWRKRIKYDLLVLKVDDITGQEATDKLHRRYNSFAKRMHQTDGDELLEMYLTALTMAFDPHTSYMSPGTLENFEIMMRLNLDGIGASLQAEDGYTIVKKIIPGGAADREGSLQVGDKIVGVAQGDDGEMVDVVDMKLSDVVEMIRGKRGTIVRLEAIDPSTHQRKVVRIKRDKIELKDSEAHAKVFDVGQRPDGRPYKIGVIELPSFYMDMEGARKGLPDFKSTTRDVRRILDGFKQDGVEAVVLDLRRNGGGSLTEAINLTGLFIPEGPVVQVKDGDGHVQPYHDLDPGMAWTGPLVVIVSKFSASASEILAGAIQDYGRGLIIGDYATHGKGTVQSLMDLSQQLFRVANAPAMGALKVTMQQFYRPSGDSTQRRGVLSDIELPSITTHLDVGEADLDYAVPFDRVESVTFNRFGYLNDAIRDQLRRRSEQRRAQSDDFGKVAERIRRYEEQKAKKYVTLNEAQFIAERKELNAEKEQEKQIEQLNESGDSTEIKRDYYLDEALAITVDYLNLRQVAKAR